MDSKLFDINGVKDAETNKFGMFDIKREKIYLNHLSIRNNKIDTEMLRLLRNKLYVGCKIKKFDISGNHIRDKGAKYLAEYFN